MVALVFQFSKCCGRLALPKGLHQTLLSIFPISNEILAEKRREREGERDGERVTCFRGLWLCSSRGFGSTQPSGVCSIKFFFSSSLTPQTTKLERLIQENLCSRV